MKILDLTSRLQPRGNLLREAAVGRDLQHIEDYLIVDGAAGGLDSLVSLRGMVADASDSSIKWDGTMAIYWGHDSSGDFYLIPNAQWAKSLVLDKDNLANEIKNTGRKRPDQTDDDYKEGRNALASKYAALWDTFENASVGTTDFFKGDIMFTGKQQPEANGNYVFTPNKVTYTVNPKGLYGKMSTAEVFVTVHGKAGELGTSKLTPADSKEVTMLNSTPQLIALDVQKPTGGIAINTSEIDGAINLVKQNAAAINAISNFTAPKFTTFKQILYNYAVKLGKSHDSLDFDDWLSTSKVSDSQKLVIAQIQKKPEWKLFWKTFLALKKVKCKVFDQLTKQHGSEVTKTLGIIANINGKPGGEGYVTSGGKIVNPNFRSAPDNPRFTGEI